MSVGLSPEPTPSPASYQPLAGCYDEMVDSAGVPREHWTHVAEVFSELGVEELLRRRQEAARLIDQDGVVYNAYDEDVRSGQRWLLDPVPTVLSSREWETIETGLIERAELLDLVLDDLYGERDLLRRRVLAPEVVFGHEGFLRPWDQVRLPGKHQLFTYAADIGRDAAGRPLVLSDRTQAPSGFGYALEARSVISRVFPTLYRDSQVHRLAPFFRSLRVSLQEVAPPAVDPDRRPHSGPLQRDGVRARVPGLAPRLSVGRGLGPGHAPRPRVDALAGAARAGARDPAPRRRLVL